MKTSIENYVGKGFFCLIEVSEFIKKKKKGGFWIKGALCCCIDHVGGILSYLPIIINVPIGSADGTLFGGGSLICIAFRIVLCVNAEEEHWGVHPGRHCPVVGHHNRCSDDKRDPRDGRTRSRGCAMEPEDEREADGDLEEDLDDEV
jgi:hypothetical protein